MSTFITLLLITLLLATLFLITLLLATLLIITLFFHYFVFHYSASIYSVSLMPALLSTLLSPSPQCSVVHLASDFLFPPGLLEATENAVVSVISLLHSTYATYGCIYVYCMVPFVMLLVLLRCFGHPLPVVRTTLGLVWDGVSLASAWTLGPLFFFIRRGSK